MNLKELNQLEKLEQMKPSQVRFNTLDVVEHDGVEYPIKSVIIGSEDKSAPTFGLFGGVHGLERVGSQIILEFFNSLFEQLKWDRDLARNLEQFRIVSIPVVNPVGMARGSRSNGNSVDLMRNAPVEADTNHTLPLVSGHRVSSILPWYRGKNGLEKESKALLEFVEQEMFTSQASVALDIHSGFGSKDQIWYPWAKSKEQFPRDLEMQKLRELLDLSFPYHIYKIERQSDNYLAHGDLWDYFFERHMQSGDNESLFLPLTLELGSWAWIKKNPVQFFSKLGLFHPIKEHRHARTMRRHLLLLDFLMRATKNHSSWSQST
ncbi:MAG: DUF2817 domain-containing protein [Bacteriovoracaceae bacterium]|nr:DUF2817 domain-containing protein [Bacteriovoracaceae bacterium]